MCVCVWLLCSCGPQPQSAPLFIFIRFISLSFSSFTILFLLVTFSIQSNFPSQISNPDTHSLLPRSVLGFFFNQKGKIPIWFWGGGGITMRAKLVVFPIRGRNWCFSRSIDHSLPASTTSSESPSTLKELWKSINVGDKPLNTKAELFTDYVANKVPIPFISRPFRFLGVSSSSL